jgi:exonuclease SbcD
MLFAHTADWHPHSMGTLAGKLALDPATGLSQTLTDFEKSLDFLFGTLLDRSIPLLLVAGDVFDNNKPTMDELRVVMAFFQRCSEAGIQVVVIPGNHDIAQSSFLATALEPVTFLGIHVVQRPQTLMLHVPSLIDRTLTKVVRIDCLPYPSRGRLLATIAGMNKKTHTPEELIALVNTGLLNILNSFQVTGFEDGLGKPDYKILLAHGSVESAVVGEQPRTLAHDVFIPALDIESHYDYVALGHIHRTQAIGNKGMYCGSLMRNGFGEEKEAKGFLAVKFTTSGVLTEHISNPYARIYQTLTCQDVAEWEGDEPPGTVYRIKDTIPEDAWPHIQPAINKFLDQVPFSQINVDIVKPDRTRDSQLNNQMTSTEALERCLERDGVEEPGLSFCRQMHLQLCEEGSP